MYKKLQALFGRITTFLHLNKRVSKYFIFLLVSLVFWFLTIMSKQYETSIFIPIVYTDLPESKQLINQPEKQIELEEDLEEQKKIATEERKRAEELERKIKELKNLTNKSEFLFIFLHIFF